MSSNHPATITFSFEGFSARGGITDEHKDGWGIAFFEDTGCRLLVDHQSSVDSPLAELIKRYPIKSKNVIAHIRKATKGRVALNNCHPFTRELWGKCWAFAHNGDLKNFDPQLNGVYRPVGDTDSELAFCYMMQKLKERFSSTQPSLDDMYLALRDLTAEIAEHGVFNYILSDGQALFAYCSTQLHYVVREHPFSSATLIDRDMHIDFSEHNTDDDRITIIATRALTSNETWIPFAGGELKMFYDGRPQK